MDSFARKALFSPSESFTALYAPVLYANKMDAIFERRRAEVICAYDPSNLNANTDLILDSLLKGAQDLVILNES